MAFTKSKPAAKRATGRGRKKTVKKDPELVKLAQEFPTELEERIRRIEQMAEEYKANIVEESLKDLEGLATKYDLSTPLVDYFALLKVGGGLAPIARPRAAAVVKEEGEPAVMEELPEEAPLEEPVVPAVAHIPAVPPVLLPATPRGPVDAVLPDGEHMQVPAMIRPKIGNDALLNVRMLKPNEIAFSINGTPLQLPRTIADMSVNNVIARQSIGGAAQEPMAECD